MDDFLTPAQAAERLSISVATVYKAVKEGRLPSQVFLGRIALRPPDVDAFRPGSYGGVERAKIPRGRAKAKQE